MSTSFDTFAGSPFGEDSRPERRAAPRTVFDTTVACDVGGIRYVEYSANLSATGVLIRATRFKAPTGAPVKVSFRVPGMAQKSELRGSVVRTDVGEDGAMVAVRFNDLPADVQQALKKLSQT